MTLHTLPEVAALWGIDAHMSNPVRYLTRQITTGRMRARKVGRSWLMSDDDIAYNFDQLANPTPAPAAADRSAPPAGLSARSARGRLAVAR